MWELQVPEGKIIMVQRAKCYKHPAEGSYFTKFIFLLLIALYGH